MKGRRGNEEVELEMQKSSVREEAKKMLFVCGIRRFYSVYA